MKALASQFFKETQENITKKLNEVNEIKFAEDFWERDGGGGGRTRVFTGGKLLEKGGVNFSEVFGSFDPKFAETLPHGDGTEFYATGTSLVLHPVNPFIPTVHANFRYIQRGKTGWFGGGADLTPYYPYFEDAVHFHKTFFEALSPFGSELYPKFKKECDEYFFLKHRNETRGIGGIFFDYQEATEENFSMVKSCANAFLDSYIPIVNKRMSEKFNESQKEFQEIRRGRYVEFNLIYDRGTVFGLKTNGRVESILMSLPLKARWVYDYKFKNGSEEEKLLDYLRPRDWLGEAGLS